MPSLVVRVALATMSYLRTYKLSHDVSIDAKAPDIRNDSSEAHRASRTARNYNLIYTLASILSALCVFRTCILSCVVVMTSVLASPPSPARLAPSKYHIPVSITKRGCVVKTCQPVRQNPRNANFTFCIGCMSTSTLSTQKNPTRPDFSR